MSFDFGSLFSQDYIVAPPAPPGVPFLGNGMPLETLLSEFLPSVEEANEMGPLAGLLRTGVEGPDETFRMMTAGVIPPGKEEEAALEAERARFADPGYPVTPSWPERPAFDPNFNRRPMDEGRQAEMEALVREMDEQALIQTLLQMQERRRGPGPSTRSRMPALPPVRYY